jgi:hypothetical protein
MSELQNLLRLLASSGQPGQPSVNFGQLVRFVAFSSRLKNEILLAQPGSFSLTGPSYPVLPPSIQEFISDACLIPLPLINVIWKSLAFYSWNMELDILPESNLNLPSIYAKYGHSRGISKNCHQ